MIALRWYIAGALVVALVGVGSFLLVRQLTPGDSPAAAELGPFWYLPALQEDAAKPQISQRVLNGVLISPDSSLAPVPDLCLRDPDGASPVPQDRIDALSTGTAVEISPTYLPEGVYLEYTDAAECSGELVNVVKRYVAPTRENPKEPRVPLWAGGSFSIARTLTSQRQYPLVGAAERLKAISLDGRQAVLLAPVMPLGVDAGIAEVAIVIPDETGITVIQGTGLPLAEFIRIANSLQKRGNQ